MKLSIAWRIGVPFTAFVLIGSVGLVALLDRQVVNDDRNRFEALATTNAAFLRHARLPSSEYLADSLERVLGVDVQFRTEAGALIKTGHLEVQNPLADVPADGKVHNVAGVEAVAVSINGDTALVLSRPIGTFWARPWRAPTLSILASFWLLSTIFGWIVGHGLVRPLENLAARIPEIEREEPIRLASALRSDEIGDVARALIRTNDALRSERRSRERAEKLAVLGRMTTALAHEIQNPVASILMHAQLWQLAASSQVSPQSQHQRAARCIEGEAKRIDDLVCQWLFLGRPEPPVTRAVDMIALSKDCLADLNDRLEHAHVRAQIQCDTTVERLVVHADARRLAQVFRNLIVNAVQAMPLGGTLRIVCEVDRSRSLGSLRFEDEGPGFSASALANFADFFYTEKEGGMGIGLSVATEIITAHGGTLTVSNLSDSGAAVQLQLPLAPGAGR